MLVRAALVDVIQLLTKVCAVLQSVTALKSSAAYWYILMYISASRDAMRAEVA